MSENIDVPWLSGVDVALSTDKEKLTGAAAFLFKQPLSASVIQVGSAPATRECAAIQPGSSVTHVHGFFLSGGSAFGLETGSAVMKFQKSRGRGVPTAGGVVPVIPGACIFDLMVGQAEPIAQEDVLKSCESASPLSLSSLCGPVGPGLGARICKMGPPGMPLSQGGMGAALKRGPRGLEALAVAVVNTVGSVVGADGQVLPGGGIRIGDLPESLRAEVARLMPPHADGRAVTASDSDVLVDVGCLIAAGHLGALAIDTSPEAQQQQEQKQHQAGSCTPPTAPPKEQPSLLSAPRDCPVVSSTLPSASENTTLVALFVNVDLARNDLLRVSRMASAGMGRALSPAFTPFDGDVIFAFGVPHFTKQQAATQLDTAPESSLIEIILGQLGAEAVAQAIRNAVLPEPKLVI